MLNDKLFWNFEPIYCAVWFDSIFKPNSTGTTRFRQNHTLSFSAKYKKGRFTVTPKPYLILFCQFTFPTSTKIDRMYNNYLPKYVR